MEKDLLIIFSAIGLVGYVAFHGHRLGVDCWMCSYRGLVFMSASVGFGAYLAIYHS